MTTDRTAAAMPNVTRRSALATTALSALGVGLMAAAGARPDPAHAEPASPGPDLLGALCTASRQTADDWVLWLRDWHAQSAEIYRHLDEAMDRLEAVVPDVPELRQLVSDLGNAYSELTILEQEREREIVVRHFPGLEPALRAVFGHAGAMSHGVAERECSQHHCTADGVSW